jgi:hypothetical protein
MNPMNVHETLAKQYRASLEALADAIRKCPDSLWLAPSYPNKYWRIAYHALFFAHLYLEDSEETFRAWPKHRAEYQFLGRLPWPPHNEPKIGEPFTKDECLEYLEFCRAEVDSRLPALDLSAPSGFHWLRFDKLETQIYNIRHIQHHTGQLSDRLRTVENTGVAWVGTA